ncbi:MAG: Flotillin domain protein [Acidobacteria bacterium]|nr:Flotillin domain protein [Acidobacteriota bacterium]
MPTGVFVMAGLMVLVLFVIVALFAGLYRKAGPHEALVVYGFRGTRIVKGHGTVIFPMVESCRDLSLELMSFDVAPKQDLYTKQGVAVTVEAVAQIKVKSDPESVQTAAEQFLTKTDHEREALIRLVMEGHLRGIIGQLTVEEIVKQPEMVADRMRSTCAEDMNKMGLEVISFTIKEVKDQNEYITNMGRPDVARIKRTPTSPLRKPNATQPSSGPMRNGRPPWREPRRTRSAFLRKRSPRRSRRKRNGTSPLKRLNIWNRSNGNRLRPTNRTRSRPT